MIENVVEGLKSDMLHVFTDLVEVCYFNILSSHSHLHYMKTVIRRKKKEETPLIQFL